MGFGTSSLGSTPLGLAEPTTAPAPPTAEQLVRDIGIDTRDYAIDSTTGNFLRTTAVRQRVKLALMTIRGSSIVQRTWGIARPAKAGDAFAAEVEASVRQALNQMTNVERVLRIDRIEVERSVSRGQATVWFTDLTTGTELSEPIPLG
jgi:hypothetical protein